MGQRTHFAVRVVALVLALVSHAAIATESGLISLRDSDQRVAAVGLRLFTGNAGLCPSLNPGTGLILHSLDQYLGASKDEAISLWAFPTAVSVEAVVPGSPADMAGLRAGDGLVSVAGLTIPAIAARGSHSTALRDSSEIYLQALPPSAAIPVTIKRNDRTLSLVLTPQPACRTRLEVVAGPALKARSDGSIIQLGQNFVAQLSDGELAFVIAHELAHTIRQHRLRLSALERQTSSTVGTQRRKLAAQFEDEADVLALDLMNNAGWNPQIAPDFMRAKGRSFDPIFRMGGAHRGALDRAKLMERVLRGRSPPS